ncbi:MAG TPA: flavodoxin family protein [Terriglobia bacterium]|nr:flavodoxin family protein [Terriglobia bacterium]
MSKRVLILSSSPRKGGNSNALCDRFMEGAIEANHQVEKVLLAEKKINYCTGCYACGGNGECVQKDDMFHILDGMVAAHVIVLATPVYFYMMCAQMKTVIDRTVARYTKLTDKEFYFIITAADTRKAALERTVEGLRAFTSCLPRAKEKGIVYGTGAWDVGDILRSPAMDQAYEMGKRL